MTWVPPYATAACQARLKQSFDGIGMKDGLTHLGLQFWQPTAEGGLRLVDDFDAVDDSTVSAFRKWGDAHDVRVMLCVYNATSKGWNWELAMSAFESHRERLIESLVNETLRLKLDGVDIDFEGKGNLAADKKSFVRFIRELSEALKAKGKELTVDSFAYKWHAPNQGWWPDLLPYVDGLHVMGYSETGAGAAAWRSYDFIRKAGGAHASKLLIGMPGNAATWQGKRVGKHIEWISHDSELGLAIWDAQLRDPAWRRHEIWEKIAKIGKGAEQGGADQPATALESKPEGNAQPKPEPEGRCQ